MPKLNLTTELTVDDIVHAVSLLDDAELKEFELQFEKLWLSRIGVVDEEAADVSAEHRLEHSKQLRLHSLLEKNSEKSLTPQEEEELNQLMSESEQKLIQSSQELLKLAA